MSQVTENVTASKKCSNAEEGKRRSGIAIMAQLIGLVKPLLPIMCLSVFLGVVGYLCAIFLTILASCGLVQYLFKTSLMNMKNGTLFVVLVLLAVCRGLLHYGEQYCNHFIAFKLLAIIRHKVFAVLRKLCPAKLEGKDKGNLISIITSDIELLEVFYAHTISPIAIAVLTSLIMVVFIGQCSPVAAVIAALGYLVVGAVIPLRNGRKGAAEGMAFRHGFGELNSFILDSLRGLDETIQYGNGAERRKQMQERSKELGQMQKNLNRYEASQRSMTNLTILLFSVGMLFWMIYAYGQGQADFAQVLIATVSMMGSFGPVVALSNLSNNLHQTLASGERVLSLLEETPQLQEVEGMEEVDFGGVKVKHVDFAYGEETILKDYSMEIPKGKIIGIHGASGSGKSTLLKLLMRFWDVNGGEIVFGMEQDMMDIAVKVQSRRNIKSINTSNLRDMEAYVTQETYLFHDSIANNIAIGKQGASREEIMEAAKKASIHDFIMSLPKGYDTEVGELGDTLSGGERQRIGIARAFLHEAPFLLLDEPTSNLDSLNEGIILKSLQESCKERTVVLVSHRQSTMNVADVVYEMENGRIS